jgi:hypothetical protein
MHNAASKQMDSQCATCTRRAARSFAVLMLCVKLIALSHHCHITAPHISQVVGFVPTGWLYEMKQTAYPQRAKGPCSVHLVPYSEHSSYAELREYVAWLRPKQVSPAAAAGV